MCFGDLTWISKEAGHGRGERTGLRVKMGRLADPPLPDLNPVVTSCHPRVMGKKTKQTKTQVPLKASLEQQFPTSEIYLMPEDPGGPDVS